MIERIIRLKRQDSIYVNTINREEIQNSFQGIEAFDNKNKMNIKKNISKDNTILSSRRESIKTKPQKNCSSPYKASKNNLQKGANGMKNKIMDKKVYSVESNIEFKNAKTPIKFIRLYIRSKPKHYNFQLNEEKYLSEIRSKLNPRQKSQSFYKDY